MCRIGLTKSLPQGLFKRPFFQEESWTRVFLLVEKLGLPRLGYFNEIINKINCEDFNYKSPLGSKEEVWRKI